MASLPHGVSVAIPTFNRVPLLRRVLDALLADPATSEIIVVDDGSTDGTLDHLRGRAAEDPRVRVLEQGGKGPAHARQAGLDAARFAVTLILDDDVVPAPGLVSGHLAHRDVAGAESIMVVGYTPSVLASERRSGDVAEVAYSRDYEKHVRRWEAGEPVLEALWAGNLSLDTERGRAIGFLSDRYQERYAVHEDRDFGLRCAEAGLRGVFDRALRGEHNYGRTIRRAAIDATRRSGGTVRLHLAHPDLGDFDEGLYTMGIPRRALPAVRAIRRDPVGGVLLETLIRLTEGLSAVGLPRAADAAFKVTRRFAEHVGLARASG